jgi:DNA-binding LacI/PurR family transcriptional regulator
MSELRLRNTNIPGFIILNLYHRPAENHTIALAAYTFLMEKKVSVPGDISVIGFDNTKESFYYDLTSYSFNVSASVQALFRCIMVNDRRSQKKRVQKIQIPGTIIVRNSTKRM